VAAIGWKKLVSKTTTGDRTFTRNDYCT